MGKTDEIRARLERLRSRLAAADAEVGEAERGARGAELEGRDLNGAFGRMMKLRFRRETLAAEIGRLEAAELPAAEAADAAAERRRHLGLALRVHANMMEAAAGADRALAALDAALVRLEGLRSRFCGEMAAAGAGAKPANWGLMLEMAAWAGSPRAAAALGLRREFRSRGRPLAEQVRVTLTPPGESDPPALPPAEPPENKRRPVGSGPVIDPRADEPPTRAEREAKAALDREVNSPQAIAARDAAIAERNAAIEARGAAPGREAAERKARSDGKARSEVSMTLAAQRAAEVAERDRRRAEAQEEQHG